MMMQLRDTVPRGDRNALEELIRLCHDPTPEVRVAAPEALETVGRSHACLPHFVCCIGAVFASCLSLRGAVHKKYAVVDAHVGVGTLTRTRTHAHPRVRVPRLPNAAMPTLKTCSRSCPQMSSTVCVKQQYMPWKDSVKRENRRQIPSRLESLRRPCWQDD